MINRSYTREDELLGGPDLAALSAPTRLCVSKCIRVSSVPPSIMALHSLALSQKEYLPLLLFYIYRTGVLMHGDIASPRSQQYRTPVTRSLNFEARLN